MKIYLLIHLVYMCETSKMELIPVFNPNGAQSIKLA